jgi:glycosyltransferase involved in cell wall biosynthesis
MKVAIVTTGLLDTLLPLAKHLAKHVSLDIYVSVYGDHFRESVGEFSLSGLPAGMVDADSTEEIIGPELRSYLREGKGNLRIHLFKYPNLKVFDRRNLQLHRKFARALNKKGYDLVHLNGYRGSQMFLYAFLKKSMARVWTVHDPVLHSGEDKWQTRLAYKSYRYLKAHYILHNQQQLPLFVSLYGIKPERCHYVPFGPLEIFRQFKNGKEEKSSASTVLFWGRISPYKGVEYLVEAAKLARKKVSDLKVVIAGKPNYAFDTSALAGDPTFEHIDGFVPNSELVKLIEQSSLVVCPYTDATQSGVLMTAYAFNKPVLATAVGGLPEVLEDGVTGQLVPPKNASALADAMVEMLQQTGKLEEMSKNIQKLNESGRFSWDTIARETLEVYKKALSE